MGGKYNKSEKQNSRKVFQSIKNWLRAGRNQHEINNSIKIDKRDELSIHRSKYAW